MKKFLASIAALSLALSAIAWQTNLPPEAKKTAKKQTTTTLKDNSTGKPTSKKRQGTSSGHSKAKAAAQTAPQGSIAIASTPAGAQIMIDGENVGTTPMIISNFPAGYHELKLSRYDHRDFTEDFYLEEDSTKIFNINMKRNCLVISSDPAKAKVYLDSKYLGTTPMTIFDIPQGRHELSFVKEGCKKLNADINFNEIATDSISYTLTREMHLTISSLPLKAEVYINNQYLGTTPIYLPERPHGQQLLAISAPDHKDFTATVDFDDILDTNVQYCLTKDEINSNRFYTNQADGEINGHEYVDLGLPSGTKWATCNIGALEPSGNGFYFQWGDTKPQTEYVEKNCKTHNKHLTNSIAGDPNRDAATARWGQSWQLPSREQFKELMNMCKWVGISVNGVPGCRIIGPNGKSIFLPASGKKFSSGTIDDINYFNKYGGWIKGSIWLDSPYYYDYDYDLKSKTKSKLKKLKGKVGISDSDNQRSHSGNFRIESRNNSQSEFSDPEVSDSSWFRYYGLPIRAVVAK